ncbi:MAG: glycoside hydrolase 5 family protein [Solirubrobacteraceae bacterium]
MPAGKDTAGGARRLARTIAIAAAILPIFATPASARTAPLTGINVHALTGASTVASIRAEVATARRLHAKAVRVEMPWSAFEPAEHRLAPRVLALATRFMKMAGAAHIRVIALLDDTPCWASTAPQPLLAQCGHGNRAEAWPPRRAADFGAFAGTIAKLYGPQLAAIEVWNEPDQANEDYLDGPEKPRHYAELLKAAYPAVKRADRNVAVLAGSIVGSNGAFMQALYRQGVKGYYDGVAVHFYNLVLGSIRRFREVQLENGDHTPLWLDEFGWSSCWPKYRIEQEQGCVTPSVQAQNLENAFHELSRAPYVDALLTYGFRDTRGEEFGVLNVRSRRKPSFAALANVLRDPFGPAGPIAVHLSTRGGRAIATGSAPVGDYMKLLAYVHGRLREEKIFTLNRFNRFRLELSRTLGTRGLTVRVYQYWLGAGVHGQASI